MQAHQRRLRRLIAEQGLDGALLASPAAVCHATGVEVFPPFDAGTEFASMPAVALLPAGEGPAWLLVPDSHAGRASRQVEGAVVEAVAGFGHFDPVDSARALREAAGRAWGELGRPRRLGCEPRWIPSGWPDLAGLADDIELIDAAATIQRARLIKSDWELERIRVAVAAADAAQNLLARTELVDRNELELWGELLGAAATVAGNEVIAFADLVTGPRTGTLSYPGGPVDRVIARGDTVILDFSVRVNGYWADTTSTVVAGAEPTDDQRRYYRASRAAFEAAVDCLRPGRLAREAEEAARGALTGAGIGAVHYAGHQLGCSVNEPPRLVRYDETPIEAGMVFAVEPGGYDAKLGVGARSEKVVLVTDAGPEVLSHFAWALD